VKARIEDGDKNEHVTSKTKVEKKKKKNK